MIISKIFKTDYDAIISVNSNLAKVAAFKKNWI